MPRWFLIGVLTLALAGVAVLVLREPGAPTVRARSPQAAPTPEEPVLAVQEPPAFVAAAPAPERPAPETADPTAALITLVEPPATRYGVCESTEADAAYAALVMRLGRRDVVFDACLGHAARELAVLQSNDEGLAASRVVDFLLRSAGAVDKGVTQAFTQTGARDDSLEAVKDRLVGLLQTESPGRPIRVGIGEAYVPSPRGMRRFIAMLLSRREVELRPTPRRADPGTRWELALTLPNGWDRPHALVMWPDGVMDDVPVAANGRLVSLALPLLHRGVAVRGTVEVSVGAEGPFGPAPLLQVPVTVGEPLPTTMALPRQPDESTLTGPNDAEPLALTLLNADRARFGLPALVREPQLDRVARAHSQDMQANGFFGHVSPTTGGPGDRILAASVRVSTHAENVAMGSSIHGAQDGLLESLGHRRNILSPDVTHVGIGIAARQTDKRLVWHLTQLFARPVARLDLAAEARRLRVQIATLRAGVVDCQADDALDSVASALAPSVARGETKDVANQAIARAKREGLLGRGGSYSWALSTPSLDTVMLPPEVKDPAYVRCGLGLAQPQDEPHGRVGLVLLLAGQR